MKCIIEVLLKINVFRFKTLEEMLQGELGVVAKEHYLNTARQMKAFEDKLYENWLQNVENTLNVHLKKPILAIGN